MPVWDDIAAINANGALTPDQKRLAKNATKTAALVDILNNGKPPPSPIPAVVGQTFMLDGYSVTLNLVQDVVINGTHVLRLSLTVTQGAVPIIAQAEDIYIVNPPIMTADRTKDLVEAAKGIIRNEIRRAVA